VSHLCLFCNIVERYVVFGLSVGSHAASLSDPYSQSTCLSVCLSVRNFDAKYIGN